MENTGYAEFDHYGSTCNSCGEYSEYCHCPINPEYLTEEED